MFSETGKNGFARTPESADLCVRAPLRQVLIAKEAQLQAEVKRLRPDADFRNPYLRGTGKMIREKKEIVAMEQRKEVVRSKAERTEVSEQIPENHDVSFLRLRRCSTLKTKI